MPKLNASKATQATEEADNWGSRVLLESGVYICQLNEVEAKEGPSGVYWAWEFTVTDPEAAGRVKLWHNTSLSEKAIGNLGKTFAGFGFEADTDTDELLGMEVWCQIGRRTIASGDRAGDLANEVQEILRPVEYDDDGDATAPEADTEAADDEGME